MLKVGDTVKIIRRGGGCSEGRSCRCYVGKIGIIKEYPYRIGNNVFVYPIRGENMGCSGFLPEDLIKVEENPNSSIIIKGE